jgi:hypothetical protein
VVLLMRSQSEFIKSRSGESTFFADPMNDRLLHALVTLAAETWVVRRRLTTLERVLEAQGVTPAEAVEQHVPTEQEQNEDAAERDQFVARVLDVLLDPDARQGRDVGDGARRWS